MLTVKKEAQQQWHCSANLIDWGLDEGGRKESYYYVKEKWRKIFSRAADSWWGPPSHCESNLPEQTYNSSSRILISWNNIHVRTWVVTERKGRSLLWTSLLEILITENEIIISYQLKTYSPYLSLELFSCLLANENVRNRDFLRLSRKCLCYFLYARDKKS